MKIGNYAIVNFMYLTIDLKVDSATAVCWVLFKSD